jgi:hypothetical protein
MENNCFSGYYRCGYRCSILTLKPIYTATLSFALEDENTGGGIGGLASQFGLDLGGGR